jgi:hypothetical protein
LEQGHALFAAGHQQRLELKFGAQGLALGDQRRLVRAGPTTASNSDRLGLTMVAPR